ncbi:helix-turn-helix transcriptional regulator [Paludicola sp. MB14-C6]|uniref:helix-turn-helix domain-containing protein n=1 Tax=Paludihabitans sp. MB14-C6 TaxID=3070656 RepID=UPI0027DE4878|nr:helix-turn-helix transcriptional regulator [Paludicola sp. MB14-C6]WMJ23485.1 helix-turn-helix transcriptional regulator [Paludicola sp. MB14-C6]
MEAKNRITPFGMKIKLALNEKGLSQKELCNKLKIDPSTLSRIIRGKNGGYSEVTIELICKELNIAC